MNQWVLKGKREEKFFTQATCKLPKIKSFGPMVLKSWKFPCSLLLTLLKCNNTRHEGNTAQGRGVHSCQAIAMAEVQFLTPWLGFFASSIRHFILEISKVLCKLQTWQQPIWQKREWVKENLSRWKSNTAENNCCWKHSGMPDWLPQGPHLAHLFLEHGNLYDVIF